MALLTATQISRLAVELLNRSLVLPNTVARVPGEDYAGPSGGTVTIRVPQPRSARTQAAKGDTITFDDVDEASVDVSLNHLYDATHVTDEDLTLTLENFGRQVLRPQILSVATGAEDELAAAMNGLDVDASIEFAAAASESDTVAQILATREQMGENGVPMGDRWFAVAPDIATRVLDVDRFVAADQRGDRTALTDALIGRLYGFNFVESSALTAGTAVAYHSSAFGFGNRAPIAPGGGADSSTASEGGVALRHILAFDVNALQVGSIVSTFAGAAAVPDDDESNPAFSRAVRIGTGS